MAPLSELLEQRAARIKRLDALPKPVLLPPKEQALYDDVARSAAFPRPRTLIYLSLIHI